MKTNIQRRRLSDPERADAEKILRFVRGRLDKLSNGDVGLYFALRRRVWKQLEYDERSKPPVRERLKVRKRAQQTNICPVCKKKLPKEDCVLDRLVQTNRYTMQNTRLIC